MLYIHLSMILIRYLTIKLPAQIIHVTLFLLNAQFLRSFKGRCYIISSDKARKNVLAISIRHFISECRPLSLFSWLFLSLWQFLCWRNIKLFVRTDTLFTYTNIFRPNKYASRLIKMLFRPNKSSFVRTYPISSERMLIRLEKF